MRTRYIVLSIICFVLVGFTGNAVLAEDTPPHSNWFADQITLPMDLVDIPQSVTEEGFPMLGNPNASVTVVQISSYSCPPCAAFTNEVFPLLLNRIRAGEIRYVFVPAWTFGGEGDGLASALGAMCASEQSSFYSYSKLLFRAQPYYGNDAFVYERLLSYAERTNLDVPTWEDCYENPDTLELLNDALDYAYAIPEFGGTPSILVNGVMLGSRDIDTINLAIDSALGNAT